MSSRYTPGAYVPPALADRSPIRVLLLGDSLTLEPIYRRAVDRVLRQEIGDVDFVGDVGLGAASGGIVGSQDLSSWRHSGVVGNTIAQVTARVAGVAAAVGTGVDIIVDISGTNDVSAQRQLADILVDKRAHITALLSTWPSARVIVGSIPTWRSGSASGGSWAAKLALRDQYVAALPGVVAGYSRVSYVDCHDGPAQEISSDGVHPGQDEHGYRRAGHRIAVEILRLHGATWRRRRPLVVAPRKAQAALSFVTTATDRAVWTAAAALAPEAQSFAATCWFRPSSLPVAVSSIMGMGLTFPAGWALCQFEDGASFYLGSNGPVFAGSSGYSDGLFAINQDYHLAVVCDRAQNKVGFGVNGKTVIHSVDLVAAGHAGANWNLAPNFYYIGKFAVQGAPGRTKEVTFYKGTAAPTIFELREFAEQTYSDGIFWRGLSTLMRLDESTGSPAEAAGVVGTGVLTGATWTTW
jgi:hypothetical protein